LLSFEEEIKTAVLYKPGPQACFLVDKMVELEKSIQEVLVKLFAHLEVIERKVDSRVADLGKVQEKVDLAMTSLSLVRDERAQVTKQMNSLSGIASASASVGIMGASLTSTHSASVSTAPPPPPPPSHPSDRILHINQVNS
jgi:hypothetical protein